MGIPPSLSETSVSPSEQICVYVDDDVNLSEELYYIYCAI